MMTDDGENGGFLSTLDIRLPTLPLVLYDSFALASHR